MSDLNNTSEFFTYVDGMIKSESALNYGWSDDRLKVLFKKKNESGFDIEVGCSPDEESVFLQTDLGYHDRFDLDEFETFAAMLADVFGLVRDILSRNMRIEEVLSNGHPRKWLLQSCRDGKWITEGSTGLLIWNIFGKKSSIIYSNDILPPRELT